LFDKIRALEVIGENCCTIQEINERIDTIFSEGRTEGITLSTVHKAKGLENDRVFIACDSLMPSKSAHMPWELEQEKNLQYVAYTRAKTYLGFLSEEEFKTRGGEHALADMRRIEDIVRITKENRERMMSGTVAYAPLVIMDSKARQKKTRVPNGGILGEKSEEPDTLFPIKRKTKSKRRR
jgi:ATP-dependent exoDNAse (exonuclease V) beta subunit